MHFFPGALHPHPSQDNFSDVDVVLQLRFFPVLDLFTLATSHFGLVWIPGYDSKANLPLVVSLSSYLFLDEFIVGFLILR